jgi:hypothetical protein
MIIPKGWKQGGEEYDSLRWEIWDNLSDMDTRARIVRGATDEALETIPYLLRSLLLSRYPRDGSQGMTQRALAELFGRSTTWVHFKEKHAVVELCIFQRRMVEKSGLESSAFDE